MPESRARTRGRTAVGIACLVGPVLLAACGGPDGAAVPVGRHPIIIIDIDTLRADRLGCYGHDRNTSPAIDRFAAESVFFEWAFSQAPNTPPSQATILTGLFPSTHGMIQDEDRLPPEVDTLAELFAAAGYATAAFHDGGYMSARFGMGQGFEIYEGHGGRGLAAIGPKAIAWVRQHADEAFLLLIHTYDVHTPYDPPSPYREMFLAGLDAPTPGFEPTPEQMEAVRLSKYTGTTLQLPVNDLEYAKALYDGGIRWVDTWVGEFLATLTELGLDRRATIVIISDHGEEFQEHGSVLHEKLYATVTHIPMMLRLPGAIPVATISEVVGAIDLAPTLLELSGLEVPQLMQGTSLVPRIRGRSPTGTVPVFSESPFFGESRAITMQDVRLLISRQGNRSELYFFRQDPLEQRNMATARPPTVLELRDTLVRWQQMIERSAIDSAATVDELTPEDREQLEALGYIQ